MFDTYRVDFNIKFFDVVSKKMEQGTHSIYVDATSKSQAIDLALSEGSYFFLTTNLESYEVVGAEIDEFPQ